MLVKVLWMSGGAGDMSSVGTNCFGFIVQLDLQVQLAEHRTSASIRDCVKSSALSPGSSSPAYGKV